MFRTLMLLVFAWQLASPLGAAPDDRFSQEVEPLLTRYCYSCHDKKGKANLKLPSLNADLIAGPDAETWHDVLNRLNRGEMPPKDADQPTDREREQIVSWLTAQLDAAVAAGRSTGGRTILRRLTRYEYNNTLRDLLGIEFDFSQNLPPEPKSADGFKNNGQSLGISPLQIEFYYQAARTAMGKAIVAGPQPDPIVHRFDKSDGASRNKKQAIGNRLDDKTLFFARMLEFPREGPFVATVTVSAEAVAGQPTPRLEVKLGVRADVFSPSKLLGEVDITGTAGEPQVIELRGRMESFPQPGANPKFPGIVLQLRNTNSFPVAVARGEGNAQPQSLIVIHSVEFSGPVYASWPPPHHQSILPAAGQLNSADQKLDYVTSVIQQFMRRAYRRPVRDDEVAGMVELYEILDQRHDSIEETMREVLASVLISPEFLYLVEPQDPTSGKGRDSLSGPELASRLSYFLWSSMPDDELLKVADGGRLAKARVIEQQVHRMLASPRAWGLVEHFTNQWLDLDGLDRIAVNPEFYPGFDDRLKQDMRQETQYFFAELLNHDLSALNLLDSDFTMLNATLARHYGLTGPTSSQFQRVQLDSETPRGGLLGQASFLLTNSNGEDSHPIKRAVWIRDRLLGDPPAPPPPDVPELKQGDTELARLSITEQLRVHRERSACDSCHRGIDPWGIPLEHFDAIGLWRDEVLRKAGKKPVHAPVVSAAQMPDGTSIEGLVQLKAYLVTQRSDQFSMALTRKLMSYALGRSLELTDNKEVDRINSRFTGSDHNLKELILAIVQSEAFTTK